MLNFPLRLPGTEKKKREREGKAICPFHTSKCRSWMYSSGEEASYVNNNNKGRHRIRACLFASSTRGENKRKFQRSDWGPVSLNFQTSCFTYQSRRASCGRWARPDGFFREQTQKRSGSVTDGSRRFQTHGGQREGESRKAPSCWPRRPRSSHQHVRYPEHASWQEMTRNWRFRAASSQRIHHRAVLQIFGRENLPREGVQNKCGAPAKSRKYRGRSFIREDRKSAGCREERRGWWWLCAI